MLPSPPCVTPVSSEPAARIVEEKDALNALRQRTLTLTYVCPKGAYTGNCPFVILKGLSHPCRRNILMQLNREELGKLFELTGNCSCPHDPRLAAGAAGDGGRAADTSVVIPVAGH